jgi:glyoxylase-like metal-dependent hydrolase (beta-lactamase superfamily II)
MSSLHTSSTLSVTKCFAAVAVAFLCANAWASAPIQKTQAPGYYRFMLGADEVTVLSDGTVDMPVDQLLKESPQKTEAALHKAFVKAPLETSVNAFLVNTGSRLVLIDTGAGTLFGPTLGKLLENLKASGYKPEQVDDVLLTHLHPDHSGGLVVGGVEQFPNATVHLMEKESAFWLSQKNLDEAPKDAKGFFQGAMASINPYKAANKLTTFDGNIEVVPGIKSYASPGHTAGHTSYIVESEGQKLLLIGDLIHVPEVQLDHPDVTIAYDSDGKGAHASRIKVFDEAAHDGVLIGASHMSFPGVGHLRQAGQSYQWLPANYAAIR